MRTVECKRQDWTYESTKMLLKLIKEYRPCVYQIDSLESMEQMWKFIVETLRNKNFHFDIRQAQIRWSNLKMIYVESTLETFGLECYEDDIKEILCMSEKSPPRNSKNDRPESKMSEEKKNTFNNGGKETEEIISNTVDNSHIKEMNKIISEIEEAIAKKTAKLKKVENKQQQTIDILTSNLQKGYKILDQLKKNKGFRDEKVSEL